MKKELDLLGFQVRDVLTGFAGTVTCVSFDVSGCIQALICPKVGADGKPTDAHWYDTKRLAKIGERLFLAPTFESVRGGQEMPCFSEMPVK